VYTAGARLFIFIAFQDRRIHCRCWEGYFQFLERCAAHRYLDLSILSAPVNSHLSAGSILAALVFGTQMVNRSFPRPELE
jgi:hypothetical protein